ncbi:MAG: RNA polymerase sigma factor [Acidobacteriota bacterium]
MKLSDEDLIQHLVEARDAGDHDQFKLAIDHLVWRRWDHVYAKVRAKVDPVDAEDVAMDAMTSAIGSFNFRGSSMGEFVSGLNTIVKYRIADHYEKKKRAENDESLEAGETGDSHGPEPGEDDEGIEALGVEVLVDEVIATRPAAHRMVIRLRIDGHSSKETSALVNEQDAADDGSREIQSAMTQANVDQIFYRFKKDLRTAIEESGGF